MDNKDPKTKKYLRIFWSLFVFPFIFLALIILLIVTGALGFMPTFEELENPRSNIASEIFSSDQKILGKYFYQNRTFVGFKELSPHLVNALIATEDARFETHSGIDGKALLRVMTGLFTGGSKGGGSTITQQLAKNLFPRDTIKGRSKILKIPRLAITKFKEWVTAIKLERNYTKEEILVMYLNTVSYGHESFGIKSAARTFFNTSSDSLKIEEAAVLVGVLKAPTYYSPVRNPERSLERRNVVLSQMKKYNFINSAVYDSVSKIPLLLSYNFQDHNQGLATYFREYLRMMMTAKEPTRKDYLDYQRYYEDSLDWLNNALYGWCNKNFKPDGTPYNIYKDGLKIYTTINYKMQSYAEQAMKEHMGKFLQDAFFKEQKGRKKAPFGWNVSDKQIQQILTSTMRRCERYRVLKSQGMNAKDIEKTFHEPLKMRVFSWKGDKDTVMTPWDSIIYYKYYLRAGFIAMEPSSGFVRAYVGGINYTHFKYDQVKVSHRQVGSTFKPIIYSLAMQTGYSPCYKVPNVSYTFLMPPGQPAYTPAYSGGKHLEKYEGKPVTLKFALANSLNQISAWVLKQFSPQAAIEMAHKMGIRSKMEPFPSICVGIPEITLYEMVGAYSTYANKGVFTEPLFVTRIEDKNGNVLAQFTPKKTEAINEETSYLMLSLMSGVIDYGTSGRIRYVYKIEGDIAGKTGTTNNNSDGWFIGITPNLAAGAWVGGEERSIHFSRTDLGQGASMALPIWALFMKKVQDDKSLGYKITEKFEKPKYLPVEVDCNKYEQEEKNKGEEVL
ncbi:MAG TPA: penicillin-binding protein [Bacteroidales bacterium]|nr:penicillin-binding protein [Bacteroidales bacterium]